MDKRKATALALLVAGAMLGGGCRSAKVVAPHFTITRGVVMVRPYMDAVRLRYEFDAFHHIGVGIKRVEFVEVVDGVDQVGEGFGFEGAGGGGLQGSFGLSGTIAKGEEGKKKLEAMKERMHAPATWSTPLAAGKSATVFDYVDLEGRKVSIEVRAR